MSAFHLTRQRGLERFLAILSAVAVFTSLMVMFAPAALAHHPEISAGQACVDEEARITYQAVSWKTDGTPGSGHPDIRIEVRVNGTGSWTQVANGAFNSGNNFRFNGTFDAGPYFGQSIEVRARSVGPWDNGVGGGQTTSTPPFAVDLNCDEDSTAVDPQVTVSEVCDVADYLVVPNTTGVDYLLNGQVVNGQTITGAFSGTLTAQAQQGYQLTNPDWSFAVLLQVGNPCPGGVTPVAPVVVQSTSCGIQGTVTFPTTPGIRYMLNGTDVSGQNLTGPISGTVVVEVLPGYALLPGAVTEFSFVVAPAEVCDEVLGEEIEPDEVDDPEVLPFTGVDSEALFALATVLLGAGWALVREMRRREEG